MKALRLVLTVLFHSLRALGRSRSDLVLENLALRQQIAVAEQDKGPASMASGRTAARGGAASGMAALAGRRRDRQA